MAGMLLGWRGCSRDGGDAGMQREQRSGPFPVPGWRAAPWDLLSSPCHLFPDPVPLVSTAAHPACGWPWPPPQPRRSSPRAWASAASTSKQLGGTGCTGQGTCGCGGAPRGETGSGQVPGLETSVTGEWASERVRPGAPGHPSGTRSSAPAPPRCSSLPTLALSSAHSFYLSFCRLRQPAPVW